MLLVMPPFFARHALGPKALWRMEATEMMQAFLLCVLRSRPRLQAGTDGASLVPIIFDFLPWFIEEVPLTQTWP